MNNLFNAVMSSPKFFEHNSNYDALFEELMEAQKEGELFIGPNKTRELFLSIKNPLDFFKSVNRTLFLGYSFTARENGMYDMKSFPSQYREIIKAYTVSRSYAKFNTNTFFMGAATLIGYINFLERNRSEIKINKNFHTQVLKECFNLVDCNTGFDATPRGREYHSGQTFDKHASQIGQRLFYAIASRALEMDKNPLAIKRIIFEYIINNFTNGSKEFKYKKTVFNLVMGEPNNIGSISQNLKNLNTFLKKEKITLTFDEEKNLIDEIFKAMKNYHKAGYDAKPKTEQIFNNVWVVMVKELGLTKKAMAYVEKSLNSLELKELPEVYREAIVSLMEWTSLGGTIESRGEPIKNKNQIKI